MPEPLAARRPPRRRRALPWRLGAVGALVTGLLLLSAGVAAAQAFPPEAVSEQGNDIRNLYFIVFGFAAAVFVLVEVVIVWLVFRYRRRNDDLPPQIHGNQRLEIIWTAIPTVIVAILFVLSFIVLDDIESSPSDDEPVEVIDDTSVRLVHINLNLIARFLGAYFDPNGAVIKVPMRPVTIGTVTTITVTAVTIAMTVIAMSIVVMTVAMPAVVLGIGLDRK